MAKDMPADAVIVRRELTRAILDCPEALVVLEAPLGMGKTVLLKAIGLQLGQPVHHGANAPVTVAPISLWDLGTAARGKLPVIEDGRRLILAKRPETRLPGLERAVAYGQAVVFGTADLLFTETELAAHLGPELAQAAMSETGGWPLALGAGLQRLDERQLTGLFASELMPQLTAEDLVWLDSRLAGHVSDSIAGPRDLVLFRLAEGVQPGGSLAAGLSRATSQDIRRRLRLPAQRAAVVAALRSASRAPDAIQMLQVAGQIESALQVLEDEQGFLMFYRYGPAAFERMMAGFPLAAQPNDETLVLCRCLQTLKRGDVARTRQMVSDRFGPDALNPLTVFSERGLFSLAFRLFRVVLTIYEDLPVSDRHLDQMYQLIGEVPADAHFERGSFYNSVLEVYIRGRRFAEAAEAAQRALTHYAAANLPIMQFYIRLHQSAIRLMDGDSQAALKSAQAARAHLADCTFESPDDQRLLTLLTACAEYESGHPEPLARFLSLDFDEFSHAELWPTVVELALSYGSQALGEQYSTITARSFLDRWRVYQAQNRQFQTLLDLREVAILQNGNRWREAGEMLMLALPGIHRTWAMSPAADLAWLDQRDMLTLALCWLRQIVFETPLRTGIAAQLDAIRTNSHLTGRQRLCVDLWRAHVFRHNRDYGQSRDILERVLDVAGRLGAVATLAEQRTFLDDLLGQKRLETSLTLSEAAQKILRRLKLRGAATRLPGGPHALTRRETKLLMMISDGSSSKFIANALSISESTVKFHLKNLYAKLGCHRRHEAIAAARALRLVS